MPDRLALRTERLVETEEDLRRCESTGIAFVRIPTETSALVPMGMVRFSSVSPSSSSSSYSFVGGVVADGTDDDGRVDGRRIVRGVV